MPTALFLVLLWSRAVLSLSLSITANCNLLSPVSRWPAGGKYGPTIDGDAEAFEAVQADFGGRKFVAAGGFAFEISSGTSNVACVCPLRRGLVPSEFVRLSPQLSRASRPFSRPWALRAGSKTSRASLFPWRSLPSTNRSYKQTRDVFQTRARASHAVAPSYRS